MRGFLLVRRRSSRRGRVCLYRRESQRRAWTRLPGEIAEPTARVLIRLHQPCVRKAAAAVLRARYGLVLDLVDDPARLDAGGMAGPPSATDETTARPFEETNIDANFARALVRVFETT